MRCNNPLTKEAKLSAAMRIVEVDDFLGSSGDYLERMMASESADVATEGRRPESEVADFIVANSTVNKSEDTSPTFADSTVTDSMIPDSSVTESIVAESRVIQSENSSSVVESKGSEPGDQTFRRLVREIDKEPNDEIGDLGENRIEGGHCLLIWSVQSPRLVGETLAE
ncbi:uncharacterized protein LOC103512958 [Diaphorina citri]|uniref:Uncharacterized protein LOC103512958 n=1 Tax=Diaphorina citri TaxID=121845 RepID=A0A1S3D7A1_DIACI|nr:uncharacterized protein LOC103512958 [Diaphorina citri]